jgi:hypothetical protein
MGLKFEGFLVAILCLSAALNLFFNSMGNIKKRTDIDEAIKKKKLIALKSVGIFNLIVAALSIITVLFFWNDL